jgi:hypothetical protein
LTGDEADVSWTEFHTRGRHKMSAGIYGKDGCVVGEDAEEDDPAGVADEDGVNTGPGTFGWGGPAGAGCPISDPGGCEHDGREPDCDAEREQMLGDVPVLPVFSLEHNLFTDQRQPLGFSNLMSTFVAGSGLRSADSGAIHKRGDVAREPGGPV